MEVPVGGLGLLRGVGDGAGAAVGSRLSPTKLTAIHIPFLGDQLSGQGCAGERTPFLELVMFSATLFHLVRYRRVVKYVSGFLACLLPGLAGLRGCCMP